MAREFLRIKYYFYKYVTHVKEAFFYDLMIDFNFLKFFLLLDFLIFLRAFVFKL
jgi:hypothetical protein